MTRIGVRAVALVLLSCLATSTHAIEPWADARLPVTSGLQLWLDAGRLDAARTAQGQPALKSGDSVEVWFDGSGGGRHVNQATPSARPRLLRVGDGWVMRFDGQDDHLRRVGLNRTLQAFTLFIVAAPHANPGDFRGFLAVNQKDRRDYESGFTVDMNWPSTPAFSQLNIEGRGFGGAQNLAATSSPFGSLHVVEATADPVLRKVRAFLDGKPAGERALAPAPLQMDEITIGARYYTNGPGAQQVRGFLPGDLAEVLLFDRALSSDEAGAIRRYLDVKYAGVREAMPASLNVVGERLVSVANPPAVQMFLPGFRVRELPVDLTNINNVRYRPDGKLMALAYDGNIYLLSDTDGDGLEDKVELFWDNKGSLRSPIGMALTPPGYRHGNGVFVASKGKCSLIVDTDGDGKADREIVIASGWQELPHGVDALGVAFDPRDESVYFGLGTGDFTNAYQVDKEGKAGYRLGSERGTVLKVAPDLKGREILCTGIRFPVGLAINRQGDLFATDQEGATWLPNGNPFDELLHLEKGRHYGFPPRHPQYLPGVIDEPSVYDYGPQHQSTCGLFFNESVGGGPVFGPTRWSGDALVAGYSRGKLYRTKLVKTAAGYVAQNQLLACLNMLAVDACVSPRGDLVVAVHSGGPDWGSGPSGKGKLYQISYLDREQPQPVAIWSAGPSEVAIAFDRPLEPQQLRGMAEKTKITHGKFVRAGDRFESLAPGYAVVQMQKSAPRLPVPVLSAQLLEDQRTVILNTALVRDADHYAVMLPELGAHASPRPGDLPQHPQIDLDFTLTGVQALWKPDAGASWSGWLPHLDLAVARAFVAGSASHDKLWEALRHSGTLTLRTRLDLADMLRPAVQPGSRIDYAWPAEEVTVQFNSPQLRLVNGRSEHQLVVKPQRNQPVEVELVLNVTGDLPSLSVSYHTAEDARPRALECRRLFLPWAEMRPATETTVARIIPELAGGDRERGRKVFFSTEANCFQCHRVHGEGGSIGPDLSNLVHRDYASVLRDVTEPSFAINPDYVTYLVVCKDGRVLTGAVRTEGEKLLIGDEKGKVTEVRRDEIEEMRPSPKSIMPEGLPKLLGPERMLDLMTFLLTEPPRMPYDEQKAPPPRTRAEVQAILAGAPTPPEKTRPIHIVLVAGKKDHGPGEHDYPAWQKTWQELLAAAPDTKVTSAWEWPSADEFQRADVMVFYQKGSWNADRARQIDAFLARGGGLVYIHFAVDGEPDTPGFAQRIGLAWKDGQSKFRHGPLDLGFQTGDKHPIGRNLSKMHMVDESYWNLTGDPKRLRLLATGVEDGQPQPLFWTVEQGKGRVFVSIPGHYSWSFDDPLFRILLLRGILWSAGEPVDRFNELATMRARVSP